MLAFLGIFVALVLEPRNQIEGYINMLLKTIEINTFKFKEQEETHCHMEWFRYRPDCVISIRK
jgi:hypothetical protein